jgi:hypothetical protein
MSHQLEKYKDYYLDKDRVIFTAAFHINRGSCCGNGCRHCPYTKPHKRGNTKLLEDMKTALYLDDVRTPTDTIPGYHPWNVVRNYEEFTNWILVNGIPDLISFDHDLAAEHINDYFSQVASQGYQHPNYDKYEEKTGLDCAKWLVDLIQANPKLVLKSCSVHSHNPVGANNIHSFINGFKKHMGWPEDCYIGKHPFTVENQ